jgi:hypothetical protein
LEPSVLLAQIESAFAEVFLGEGVSLEETEYVDEFWEIPKPRPQRDPVPWSHLRDEELVNFMGFSFLDSLGMRYYVPAFMHWYLRSIEEPVQGANAYDSLSSALRTHYPLKEPYDLLSNDQRCCILAFLEYLTAFDRDPLADRAVWPWRAACDPTSD